MVIFEDFGNGQTKLTMIGNETMEDAKNSGQLEGWNQILEKVAAAKAFGEEWRRPPRLPMLFERLTCLPAYLIC